MNNSSTCPKQLTKTLALRARVFIHRFLVFEYPVKLSLSLFIYYISNSLILHSIKTKENSSEMEVWICEETLHKLSQLSPRFSLKILICLWCYTKHLEECFIRLSKHLEICSKTSASLRISTKFSVFGYPDETLFLVFNISHQDPISMNI